MNTSRTLEQLEATPWQAPSADSSPMILRCHSLRKVPLQDLSAGDCRLLIGQEVGTKYVTPLALNFLQAEPLVEGDYYPGDLLLSMFRLPDSYWAEHQEQFIELLAAAKKASEQLATMTCLTGSEEKLRREVDAFIQQGTV